MKTLLSLLVVLSVSEVLVAEESVSVPWTEFKDLYRESIERHIMSKQVSPGKEPEPQVYTIKEAVYRITLDKQNGRGEVLISGRILSGKPTPIPLFGTDIVISGTSQISGGSLMSDDNNRTGIFFLPDGRKDEFQIALSFLVRPQEDSRSRFVSFAIPSALRNSLHIQFPPEISLLEEPGIPDKDGAYYFSSATELAIRFVDKKDVSATSLVDIDTFSSVRLQGSRAMIATAFVPVQPVPQSIVLRVENDAQFVSSSLKGSWIAQREDGAYEISIPPGYGDLFTIQFAIDESKASSEFIFALPSIESNNGHEGDFVLEEPDDGQITLTGKELVAEIPVARLNTRLAQVIGGNRFYTHISTQEPISLKVTRFQPVSTPPLVLDSQYFFTSFEENGSVMSVLVMDIPSEIGPRLMLKAIPDAKIWSLTVNGRKRKVYSNSDSTWIIPLEDGEESHVEFAFLRHGEKLGLHGRLEAVVPETGLPARTVRVGIALPDRVQILSLEGPVNPSSAPSLQAPVEFVGTSHHFSRNFYKGEGMTLAISYKEPPDQNEATVAEQE